MKATWVLAAGFVATAASGVFAQTTLTKSDTPRMNAAADWSGTAPGPGYVGQFNGTISASNAASLVLGGNVTLDGLSFLGSLSGPVTMGGGETLTLGTNGIAMGSANRDVTLNCAVALAGNGTWNVAANRTLNVSGTVTGGFDVTKTGSGALSMSGGTAEAPSSLGRLKANAGTVNISGYFNAGSGINLNGGTVNWSARGSSGGSYFAVGDGKESSMSVIGGYLLAGPSNSFFIAKGSAGTNALQCTLSLDGGNVTVTADCPIYLGSGFDGSGGGSGILTINSGTFDTGTTTNVFQLGDNGGAGTINLNGGTLATSRAFTAGANATNSGTSTFNFNGGTLKANGNQGTLLAGLTTANIRNGGAVIDDNGKNITIAQALVHSTLQGDAATDGGLIKRGAGMLTLSGNNSYTGPTAIQSGTLRMAGRHNGGGLFQVESGGTLSGVGTINAPVAVAAGGCVAPGTGTLTTGPLTLGAQSKLSFLIGQSQSGKNAKLAVNGDLVLDGVIEILDAGALSQGSLSTVITYTGNLTDNGLTSSPVSSWNISIDTSSSKSVRITAVAPAPVLSIAGGDRQVDSTSTNLSGTATFSRSGSIWYEVRDSSGTMRDFGATLGRNEWSITVRHLRPGANTVTVFSKNSGGATESASVQLTLPVGDAPSVRPRPFPAEIWWGGLSDNSGMVNYDQWPFVQKYQDGYFFHSAGWGKSTAYALATNLAQNLLKYNTRYWPELGGKLRDYGWDDATAQDQFNQWATWAEGMESRGIVWSEFTHDYRMEDMQTLCAVNPTWPPEDQIAWFTGDLSIKSAAFPMTDGIWSKVFAGYASRFPHVKTGHTSQPEYWPWQGYPSLMNNQLAFSTATTPPVAFSFDAKDIIASFLNMAQSSGRPYFALASDAPYNYSGEFAYYSSWPGANPALMREKIRVYEQYIRSRNGRHTFICNVGNAGAQPGGADAQDKYYEDCSLKSLYLYQKEGGRADRYLFESWYQGIPSAVVPETKPGSYTHLAMTAIKYLKGISDLQGTLEPLSLSLSAGSANGTLTITNGGDVACMPSIVAFESPSTGVVTRYFHQGRDVTDAITSEDGYAIGDLLQPGASASIEIRNYAAAAPSPPQAGRTVTFEAFWNPQDPTGVVRDRLSATWHAVLPAAPVAAGAVLVDLRANDSTAPSAVWANRGSLGSGLARTGSPVLVSDVLSTRVPGVQFGGSGQSFAGLASTADIEGFADRSVEVWAYNPSLSNEETMVSWGHRYETRRNMAVNFGSNSDYGAATHYGDDAGWGGSPPSENAWHHVVYTYSASTVNVYVDGALASTKRLGGPLDTFAGEPINIGCQRESANGTRSFHFSGFINSARIHGGVLSASDVARNYALGPFKMTDASLVSLTPSSGVLVPSFDPLVLSYTLDLPSTVDSVDFTLSFGDATASATLNGVPVKNGSPSAALSLNLGANMVVAAVTAQDGVTARSYSVVVNRGKPYEAWAAQAGISGAPFGADSDGDAIANGIEYAIGGSPGAPDQLPALVGVGSGWLLEFTKGAAARNDRSLTYCFETSTDLSAWNEAPPSTESESSVGFLLQLPGPRKFVRLKVKYQP
jgi:autotransporter-associated beta strand protein